MKIRINSEEMIKFLDLINLQGLVFDCIIKAEKKLLVTRGLDVAKAVFYRLEFPCQVLKPGMLIIGNIALFSKILSRFNGAVTIEADDKIIKVRKSNKIGKFAVAKKKDIDSFNGAKSINIEKNIVTTPKLKMKFNNSFILEADLLVEIVKDAEVLDEHIYSLEAKEGLICRVNKDGNSFSTRIKLAKKQIKNKMQQNFGHGVREVFNTLRDKITLYLDAKSPGMLIRFGEGFKNIYVITGVERKA